MYYEIKIILGKIIYCILQNENKKVREAKFGKKLAKLKPPPHS